MPYEPPAAANDAAQHADTDYGLDSSTRSRPRTMTFEFALNTQDPFAPSETASINFTPSPPPTSPQIWNAEWLVHVECHRADVSRNRGAASSARARQTGSSAGREFRTRSRRGPLKTQGGGGCKTVPSTERWSSFEEKGVRLAGRQLGRCHAPEPAGACRLQRGSSCSRARS
jgi:hypothetical protein